MVLKYRDETLKINKKLGDKMAKIQECVLFFEDQFRWSGTRGSDWSYRCNKLCPSSGLDPLLKP